MVSVLAMNKKRRSKGGAPPRRRGRLVQAIVVGLVAMFLVPTATGSASTGSAAPPTCASPGPGEPIFVTEDCVDPRYDHTDFFIDVDEVRSAPVPHRFVHGGFNGTDAKFAFYFPEQEQYDGRFIHGSVHQLRGTRELSTAAEINFAFDSGAYVVNTNNGGSEACVTAPDCASGRFDITIREYRVNAAAVKVSRALAAQHYGAHRPYGYLFGGSGGGFMTLASAENTAGVWDGFVPYVMGTDNNSPSAFAARLHALRILRIRNKWPEVMDAIDPGGSGDPYATLNEEEADALRELTRFGFPPRGWWNHATMTGGPLSLTAAFVRIFDPTYTEDFWTKPGYLGTDPTSSISAFRIQHPTSVVAVTPPPPGTMNRLVLDSLPQGDLETWGADLVVLSGAAAGKTISLASFDRTTNTVGFAFDADPAVTNSIVAGDQVQVDNSYPLALQTHHRHQVPLRDYYTGVPTRDYYSWSQFRHGGNGSPIYPQRDVLVGEKSREPLIPHGGFHGKMIIVENLMDIEAFPWQADWYRTRAMRVFKEEKKSLDDHFRVWFTDHAQHGNPGSGQAQARTVSYTGVLQQALRDLASWVEEDVPAPASTSYDVADTQVLVPPTAGERRGIQPVVDLKVNGGVRADVAVGQPVTFTATIQAPPGTGRVVNGEWGFRGTGSDYQAVQFTPQPTVTLTATFAYSEPGTYFPVLRATSQREGDPNTPHARILNLGRVRVVVE